jgi:hypothetical protein
MAFRVLREAAKGNEISTDGDLRLAGSFMRLHASDIFQWHPTCYRMWTDTVR